MLLNGSNRIHLNLFATILRLDLPLRPLTMLLLRLLNLDLHHTTLSFPMTHR